MYSKVSAGETKLTSLEVRTRPTFLETLISKYDFGPVKLPGLSRNGSQVRLLHQFNYLKGLLYSGCFAVEAGLRVSSYLSGGLRLRNYRAVDRGIINSAHSFRFLRVLSAVTKISPAWFVRTTILETSLQNSPLHKSFCHLLKEARNNLFCSSHLVFVRRNLLL